MCCFPVRAIDSLYPQDRGPRPERCGGPLGDPADVCHVLVRVKLAQLVFVLWRPWPLSKAEEAGPADNRRQRAPQIVSNLIGALGAIELAQARIIGRQPALLHGPSALPASAAMSQFSHTPLLAAM